MPKEEPSVLSDDPEAQKKRIRSETGKPARTGARPRAPRFTAAGFWRRALAGLVDLAVVLPVALIFTKLAAIVANVHLPASRHRGLDAWLDLLLASDPALLGGCGLILAIGLIYLMIFQATQGRTLGMRTAKIQIIDLYGDKPSPIRAMVRTLGYAASMATLGLGFFWVAFDAEKRGLHDWIAGTHVVMA